MSDLDANRQRFALKALAAGLTFEEFAKLCERLRMEQATEGMTLFEMQVEEYVASAKAAKSARTRSMTALVAAMLEALEGAGLAEELVTEARAALKESDYRG